MVNEQPKSSSWVTIVVVMIVAAALFGAGFYFGQGNNSTTYSGFSGSDRNFLSQLEFVGGFCERQGLISSFRTAYNTDLNRYEGFPVCIQKQ